MKLFQKAGAWIGRMTRVQVFVLVVLLAAVCGLHQYAFLLLSETSKLWSPQNHGTIQNVGNEMRVLIVNENRAAPQRETTWSNFSAIERSPKYRKARDAPSLKNHFRRKFCKDKIKWRSSRFLSPVTSEMDYWSFDRIRKCEDLPFDENRSQKLRLKVSLKCEPVGISLHWTKDTTNIFRSQFANKCLEDYINSCCTGVNKVPNVVHYVWYGRGELGFVGFASLISVIRFVNPCLIIFHGDSVPYGRYWDFIINISPNIIHLQRKRPTSAFGQKMVYKEHAGDIMRIQALLKYGGIYMDTDTVLVRPVDSLRNQSYIMSTQVGKLGSAFIMAEKNATFLQQWLEGYRLFYDRFSYTYNAMTYPKVLAHFRSELIHIEEGTISRPRDMIGKKFYMHRYSTYNWAYVHGFHLFTRSYKGELNETTIKTMASACGSVLRHVVYGNKEFCF